jgi:hypothetical protein
MKDTKEIKKIKGWGIDADSKNNPTYPLKHRKDGEHAGYDWERPSQQRVNIKVLHSIERPNIPAVFGTSVPPRGLSGMVRKLAFKYSEGSFAHWLPLLMADRIDVIEGFVSDLAHGRFPNIPAEKGWRARWKYNRKKAVQNLIIGGMLASAAIGYVFYTFGKSKKIGMGCC